VTSFEEEILKQRRRIKEEIKRVEIEVKELERRYNAGEISSGELAQHVAELIVNSFINLITGRDLEDRREWRVRGLPSRLLVQAFIRWPNQLKAPQKPLDENLSSKR
jgi:hypothetical protein